MRVIKIEKPYTTYGMDFWDTWIGPGEIDCTYLSRQMLCSQNTKLLLLGDDNSLEGICIFSKVPCFHIYKIHLIAKKGESRVKGVGKAFVSYLQKEYGDKDKSNKATLLLSDDSRIVDYYKKLGFTQTRNICYKWLLADWFYPIYYKKV